MIERKCECGGEMMFDRTAYDETRRATVHIGHCLRCHATVEVPESQLTEDEYDAYMDAMDRLSDM